MAMTITYEFGGSLYVNFTNQCSNDCVFCLRNNHDNVNGEDNLWLDHEPTFDEIKADFEKRDMKSYNWVVFCGYGEPLMKFDICIKTAKWLKATYPHIKIRINTNGQVNMIEKRDVTPEFHKIIDALSISLNAPDAKRYDQLCKSTFGEAAFAGLLDFAKKAKKYVPSVTLSIVDKDLTCEDIDKCKALAKDCNVSFRIREYIE
ncbi:MAG: TatD family nuclease-associated radical SAM protein [Clostridia bacterium]|nr:TatD family nuclease-associated radical SAM protein [Clostridia bacterium]